MYPAADSPAGPAPDAATAPDESNFARVPALLRAALERRGFRTLTAVQDAVLAADDGKGDLQVSSRTGSGKTVALGFVLASRAADAKKRVGPNTLLIVPTRELAMQVGDELAWLFADLPGVTVDCVTGGTSIHMERIRLARRPAVLVGTPGRLLDHIRNLALDCSGIDQLVLDEADQMLDMGFRDELDGILESLPAERRTHLLSATFPPEVRELTHRYQHDPLMIEGSSPHEAHADIEHIAHPIGPRDRYAALVNLLLLAGQERTLVFVRTRQDTTGLADKLAGDGFGALPISGDLAQAQRTRTLEAFRRGSITTLIATDVAARGLDIPAVTRVVHVDPPIDAATYTHRSGRTGRAGQKGQSIVLVPRNRESRIRGLLRQARVQANWQPVPGAATIRVVQHDRQVEKVRAVLAAAQPDERQLEFANELLQSGDAPAIVAGLLATLGDDAPRAPFPFDEPVAHAAHRAPKQVRSAPEPARPAASPAAAHPMTAAPVSAAPGPAALGPVIAAPPAAVEPAVEPSAPKQPTSHRERPLAEGRRGRPGASPSWATKPAGSDRRGAPRHHDSSPAGERGFRRFRINWGTRQGATPQRILAHVCRRGDIDSRQVGAIAMQPLQSTFDVADAVAEPFALRVRRPDHRDPQLRITPDAPSPRHAHGTQAWEPGHE